MFGAVNCGGISVFSVTVNGVLFSQFNTRSGGSEVTTGHFSFTAPSGVISGVDYSGPTPGAGISDLYSALLGGSTRRMETNGITGPLFLTINDLIIGQNYEVQVWANDSVELLSGSETLTAINSVSLQFNTSGSGGRGQFTIGTFTATASSEEITISPVGTQVPTTLVSAVQVRVLSGSTGPSKLANISTRARVDTGDNALIGGFIITGAAKKVIVRALGPSLSMSGVAGVLPDPQLDLYDATGTLLIHNDNWRSNQEQEIIDTTLLPSSDLEAAIVATLQPGAYTAVVRGIDNGAGVALVEVYDLD